MRPHGNGGQSFLALILLVGIIVVAVGVTLAFLATSAVNNIYAYKAAARAQAVAQSGAEDALLQLARNVQFSTSSYAVAVGSDTATVAVTQNSSAGTATVLSTATVSGSTKKVQVVVATNATTSAMSVVSWTNVQ